MKMNCSLRYKDVFFSVCYQQDWGRKRRHKQSNHETNLMFKGELKPKVEPFLYCNLQFKYQCLNGFLLFNLFGLTSSRKYFSYRVLTQQHRRSQKKNDVIVDNMSLVGRKIRNLRHPCFKTYVQQLCQSYVASYGD